MIYFKSFQTSHQSWRECKGSPVKLGGTVHHLAKGTEKWEGGKGWEDGSVELESERG